MTSGSILPGLIYFLVAFTFCAQTIAEPIKAGRSILTEATEVEGDSKVVVEQCVMTPAMGVIL